jgi:cyclophilin family peptidyl-prolyl cis-trans isomerase
MTLPAVSSKVVMFVLAVVAPVQAQSAAPVRLEILLAEARGGKSTRDLHILRQGTRHRDGETARMAVRALGRLERPVLIQDILLRLTHELPEVRAESANAAAQAAQGLARDTSIAATGILRNTQGALVGRLREEDDASVRAALCEAIARLPYRATSDLDRAEAALLETASSRAASLADRLGHARSFEALVRLHTSVRPTSPQILDLLRGFAAPPAGQTGQDFARNARIRRLAIQALISARAIDDELVERAGRDPDAQVRRLAMRAVAETEAGIGSVPNGLLDPAAMVRLEALSALWARRAAWACDASVNALSDPDMAVVLTAIDQLRGCGEAPKAVDALASIVGNTSDLGTARGWHRNAHALVALAAAAPDRVGDAIARDAASPTWQMRAYAARAAAAASNRPMLETLSADSDTRVASVALGALGFEPRRSNDANDFAAVTPTVDELRRLASPRAIVTIRDVGRVELALFTAEAPATVLRFAQLAESGYYDGTTFDRVTPNLTAQGGGRPADGRPAGNVQYSGLELGLWPHVRGAVGTALSETGDAQIFVNLVDNPHFDHRYTVFAQVLNGADRVDSILEGDVIESIQIVP